MIEQKAGPGVSQETRTERLQVPRKQRVQQRERLEAAFHSEELNKATLLTPPWDRSRVPTWLLGTHFLLLGLSVKERSIMLIRFPNSSLSIHTPLEMWSPPCMLTHPLNDQNLHNSMKFWNFLSSDGEEFTTCGVLDSGLYLVDLGCFLIYDLMPGC